MGGHSCHEHLPVAIMTKSTTQATNVWRLCSLASVCVNKTLPYVYKVLDDQGMISCTCQVCLSVCLEPLNAMWRTYEMEGTLYHSINTCSFLNWKHGLKRLDRLLYIQVNKLWQLICFLQILSASFCFERQETKDKNDMFSSCSFPLSSD